MIGYNVAVLLWPATGVFQHLERLVGGVHFNPTPRLVCVKLLCNKFSPCEVVNAMDNSFVPPPLLQNPGIPPVEMVRDPRIGRLWTKYKETDLPVPKFKVSTLTESMMPAFSLWKRGAVKSCRHTPPLTHLWDVG